MRAPDAPASAPGARPENAGRGRTAVALALALLDGCGGRPSEPPDGGVPPAEDAGTADAGTAQPDAGADAGGVDAGSTDAGISDAGTGDGGFSPAPHAPFPQIPYQGGPTLSAPRLVPITFAGYPYAAEIAQWSGWIASSSWLATVGADYGVTGATAAPLVVLDGGAPTIQRPEDLAALLAEAFDGGAIPAPASLAQPLYVVFFPPDAGIAGVCQQVFSYHAAGRYEGAPFAFVLDADCPEQVTGYPETEQIELTAGHEIVESAANPYSTVDGGIGWQLTDPASPWWAPGAGEIADLCEGPVYFDADAGVYAPLVWSNRAAARGDGSPCLPSPGAYFNASPTPDAVVTLDGGASFRVTLTGWSAAPSPPWGIAVMADFGDFDPQPQLVASALENGGDAGVTVAVPPGTPSGARAVVWIGSYAQGSPDWTSFWPIAVEAR